MSEDKNVERLLGLYEYKTKKSGITYQTPFLMDVHGEYQEFENGTVKLLRPLTKEESDEILAFESDVCQAVWAFEEKEAEG